MSEPGDSWKKHCLKRHPKPPWSCVTSLLGSRIMCCVGNCKWEGGRG